MRVIKQTIPLTGLAKMKMPNDNGIIDYYILPHLSPKNRYAFKFYYMLGVSHPPYSFRRILRIGLGILLPQILIAHFLLCAYVFSRVLDDK